MISSANRKMSAELGALFDSLEALSSSDARGFVLDRLRCVLADSLTETLIFDARPALITDFFHGLGTFSFLYLTDPFDEAFRACLARHPFEAHTFPEPILYLSIPSIFIDDEEMSFKNFMRGLVELLLSL
nr:hypothetical protein [Tanacetum cinerariifolium]